VGWTSHDVVAVVRGVIRLRHVGHGGTLDPAASGVLPILVGAATKFAVRLHEATKVYDAVVRFGRETSTDDREGETTRDAPVPALDEVEPALAGLRGVIAQVPPQFSALKVGGRTAYARARAGETVALAARAVQVYRLEMIETTPTDARLLVVCSSGTYVRSIARDLGRALKSAAHLAALRRLAVGSMEVGEAVTPDVLRASGREATLAGIRSADERILRIHPRYLESPAGTLVSSGGSVG
jgi:tRNA pseudouridine55 synthase